MNDFEVSTKSKLNIKKIIITKKLKSFFVVNLEESEIRLKSTKKP